MMGKRNSFSLKGYKFIDIYLPRRKPTQERRLGKGNEMIAHDSVMSTWG